MPNIFFGCFKHETCANEDILHILLNFEQKQHRKDIVQDILTTFNDNPDFLNKVLTIDDSCVYGYDIETKSQESQSQKKNPNTHSWRYQEARFRNVSGIGKMSA